MKKFSLYLSLLGLVLLTNFQSLSAQLTGTKNIPGDYATLDLAIIDLNTQGVGPGGVTLNVLAGNPQVAPLGGYQITTTTASLANPVIIQGNTNPVVAFPNQTAGSLNDAIFKIIGADFIAITGFIMSENPANTITAVATNNMTEWGVALLYASATNGAQFNGIAGNAISLNRNYTNTFAIYSNTRHTATNVTTAADITAASGSNSGNRIVANIISNVNMGVAFIGSNNALFQDIGNYVGGGQAIMGNTITNWGGAAATTSFVSNSGTSYCIFMNHQNTYNVSNNTITSAAVNPAVTFRGIVQDFTSTSPVGIITDTISNNTITMTSSATSGTFRAIDAASGNSTTTLHITGNNILNCAITGASSSTLVGISNSGSINILNINNNIIRSNTSTATSGGFTGIVNSGTVTTAVNINNNQIGNASGGAITFSAATTGTVLGVSSTAAATTCSTSIQGNDIRGIVHSVAGGSTHTYITATGTSLSLIIANNTFTNLNVNSTGTTTFINHNYTMPASGSTTISGNSVVTAFNKTAASGSVVISTTNGSSPNGSTAAYSNNNFSNITISGTSSITGFNNTDGNTGTSTKTITGNTFDSWTSVTGSIIGMNVSYWNGASSLSSNTLTNFTGQSSITGLSINSSLNNAPSISVAGNVINTFSSTAAGGGVTGITISNTSPSISITGNTINTLSSTGASTVSAIVVTGATATLVSKNKIYDLLSSNAGGSVNGLLISGGTAVTASNNLIGDLRATLANATNPLNGISVTGGTNINIYYNTVNLNATSSGAVFGSSGISSATGPTLDLRNNLVVNLSTPNSTGFTVAYRRSSATLTSYSNSSNNNSFYAGTPGANNLIFYDGTNSIQTLAAYKVFVTPRDGASLSENPIFSSTSGVSPVFLHIPAATSTLLESGGAVIATITTDYDNDTRPGPAGSVNGGGSAPDIGADEFDGAPVLCAAANGGVIAPTTYSRCENQTVVLTSTGTTSGPGITYQWMVSATPGGPYSNVTGGSGATTTSFTSGALVAGTYYYVLQTTCSVGPLTGLSNEVTVTVNPAPTISVTPTSGTICLPGGAAISLTASGTSVSYAWLPVAGLTPSTGATVSALPAATTTYTVTGTDGAGCTNTATTIITVSETPTSPVASATPTSVCSGGNSQLLVTSSLTGLAGYTVSNIPFAGIATPGTGVTTLANAGVAISTLSSGTLDDGGWQDQILPFSFSFFGTSYSSFAVSTNGFVVLGAGAPNTFAGYGTTFPSASAGRPSIGATYSDLDFRTIGTIEYFTTGTAPNRAFVINWKNGNFYNTVGAIRTQLIIYETTNIIEVHTNNSTGTNAAVEGIQNATGTVANTVAGRNNTNWSVVVPDAYRWAPNGSLTYSWTPPTFLSSTTINNPTANAITSTTTYTVTVTNGGCSTTASTTITSGAALTSTAITTNSPVCQGVDIVATAHPSGGGAPYTYSWDIDGGTPFTSPTATVTIPGLAPGTYTLNSLVTDNCSATTSQSISITVNPTPTASASSNSPLCAGNTINLTGITDIGTVFNWSGPASFTSTSQSPSILSSTSLMSGTYSFTATLGTCTSTVATTVVAVNPNPSGVTANTTSSTICLGASVDLSSSATQSGNILTENFNSGAATWTRFNTSVGGTVAATAWTDRPDGYVYSGGTPYHSNDNTTFVQSNSDAQGSGSISTNTIIQSPSFSTAGMSNINLNFFHFFRDVGDNGDSAVVEASLNGSTWSVVNAFTATTGSENAFANANLVLPGTFDNQPTVYVRFRYIATWDWYWSLDNVTISGTASPVTFAWTSSPAGFTSAAQNPTGVAPTTTTTYTVTATNGFGCTNTASTAVTVNPLPTVNYTISPNDTVCAGTSVTLSGTGATSYSWTGGVTNATPFTPSSTLTYTVTGTDGNSCTNTTSVQVVVNTLPAVSYTATPNDTVCAGTSITLSGTGANTYTWTGGITNGVSFTPVASGNYTVTGTTTAGCSNTAAMHVQVNTIPVVSISGNTNLCPGGTNLLTGTSGGTSQWYLNGAPILGATTNTYNATAPGHYNMIKTNVGGCADSSVTGLNVISVPAPSVSYTVSPNDTVCAGGSVTLTGTGATSYSWTGGITDAVAFTPVSTLTYTVTGTDVNSCTNTASVQVVVSPIPVVGYTASPNDTVCAGTSVTLSGTGANTYTWTGGITDGVLFTPVTSGNYTVTGTSSFGCTSTASMHLQVNSLPVVSLSGNTNLCPGGNNLLTGTSGGTSQWYLNGSPIVGATSNTYSATAPGHYNMIKTNLNGCGDSAAVGLNIISVPNPTVSYTATPNDTVCTGSSVTLSGTGATSYTWTGGITDAIAFTPVASLTYTVTGTDGNGCTNTASAPIVVNSLPTVSYSVAANDTVCAGGNVTLSGTGAASYTWTGGITNAVAFTPGGSLTYTVTGTDAFGCSNTASAPIVVNSLPTVGYTVSPNDTVCAGTSVTLSGTGAASYSWTGGITNAVAFTPGGSLTYTVTGTDAFGCSGTASAPIVVGTIPTVNLGPDVVQPNPPAVLNAGAGFISYLWSTSEVTQTISVNTNGQYIVTVTNVFGCSDSDTINVNFTSGVVNIDGTPTIFSLYPNPTSNGIFNVSIQNIETSNLVMEVLDMNGSVVHNKYIGSANGNVIEPFSLTDLRMGTYIMRITANGKATQLRFIINK